ncbi:MAG: hypothetical protein CM15mV72_050 [uncultured marine virus]|nr:MAG: hypothetical protein CM15mV72_050 [uncultured marine virus]
MDEDTDKTYRFSRVYNLFNIEQIGIDPPEIEHRDSSLEDPYELPRAMGITVEEDESHNPLLPLKDTIRMQRHLSLYLTMSFVQRYIMNAHMQLGIARDLTVI